MDADFETYEEVTCPACAADQHHLDAIQGVLGTLAHLRCRHCGNWWTVRASSLIVDETSDFH